MGRTPVGLEPESYPAGSPLASQQDMGSVLLVYQIHRKVAQTSTFRQSDCMRRPGTSGMVFAEMATTIRPEISPYSRWHISKHRYYELKHFCLQYHEWHADKCEYRVLVRHICEQADSSLSEYLLKAVTEGYSYTYLKTCMNMPCGRSMYFDRYRKFFWLLSKVR